LIDIDKEHFMYPVLFKLGRLQVHAYGLLLAVSFLVGILWAMRRGEKRGIPGDSVMDAGLYVVISAIIGSRLFYVVTHIDEFRGRWFDTVNPFQSSGEIGIAGLSMLGGVVMAIATIMIFCRIKRLSILRFFDSAAPSLALGLALTRIGCFLNGCCFGKPGNLPWCVVFPDSSPAGVFLPDQHLHPTQLYSSLFDFLILGALLLADRKKRPAGMLSALFFILYGAFRFLIDFVRYYESTVQFHVLGFAFTFNQLIAMLMMVAGVAMFWVLRRKGKRSK
jgi:phosphatidylglycerol---prolipoprotein diacylglyceryl transferase